MIWSGSRTSLRGLRCAPCWRREGNKIAGIAPQQGRSQQAVARRQGSERLAIQQVHKPLSIGPSKTGRHEPLARSPGKRPCTALGTGLLHWESCEQEERMDHFHVAMWIYGRDASDHSPGALSGAESVRKPCETVQNPEIKHPEQIAKENS